MVNPTAFFRNYCSIVKCMHGILFVCLFSQCTCFKTTNQIMSPLIPRPCAGYSEAPRGYVIYSSRAAPSVNTSHIPSLSQNNPYLTSAETRGLCKSRFFCAEVVWKRKIGETGVICFLKVFSSSSLCIPGKEPFKLVLTFGFFWDEETSSISTPPGCHRPGPEPGPLDSKLSATNILHLLYHEIQIRSNLTVRFFNLVLPSTCKEIMDKNM